MNSVKCVAAALMLASSVVNGARVRRDDGYGAPQEDTYGAPAESYGAPVESYGASAPSYGAAAETGLDLTTIIIPLLALLGLFLLFPTYVTLTSVRRKREAIDDSEVSVNAVERMMDMYQVKAKYLLEIFLDLNLKYFFRLLLSLRSVLRELPVTLVPWPLMLASTPAWPPWPPSWCPTSTAST